MHSSVSTRSALLAWLIVCFLLISCSSPQPTVATGPEEPTAIEDVSSEKLVQRLDNGLQVVIQRDTRSPLVAVVTRVGAGYLNEEEDEAGVSHLLEHMILQGTRSHSSAAEMSAQLRALGARVNAATTYDHTESWMVLPAAQAEGGIQLAGEIYSEPLLDPAVMEVEKRRVREEILRKLEDPVAFARDELLQLIYSGHSMGRGSEEILAQLDAITIEQLQRFHDDHYRPTNTTLTVVGDVDPAAVLVQIEQAFGGVERGNLRLHAGPAPPRPDALHYAAFRGNYDPNLVMIGFPLPGEGHADLPALELLSVILVDGQASRMRLPLERRNDIVFELESRVVRYEGEGLFEILIAAPDKREDQALRTLFVQLDRIRRFGVGESELLAARRILSNRWTERRQDVLSQARELAASVAPATEDALQGPQSWATVTSADLQEIVTRRLGISRASVVQLLDQTLMNARPFYAMMDAPAMQAHLEGAVLAAAPALSPFVLPPPPPSTQSRLELAGWAREFDASDAGQQSRLRRVQFDNGTVLVVQEDAALPSTYVSIWFRGGRVAEVANSSGSTALIQKLMQGQSLNRQSSSLGRELDGLGTRIQELRELDGFGFGAEVYRAELPYVFDILYDLVANPRFGLVELERARQQQYREIQKQDRMLYARTAQLMRQAAWGTHGYALPEFGTPETVKLARPDRLEELQIESCDPSNAVIAVAGAVDAELLVEFLQLYMGGWSDLSDLFPEGADAFFASEFIDPLPVIEDGAVAEIHRSSPLAALQMGFAAPGPRDPAYPGVEVLSAWLAGPGGALWRSLEPQNQSMPLGMSDQGGALGSILGSYAVTSSGELLDDEASLLEAFRSVGQSPPSQNEASQAAREVAADLRIAHQSLASRAGELARREILGLPAQSIEEAAVDREAVSAADLSTLLQSIFVDGAHAVGRVQGSQNSNP